MPLLLRTVGIRDLAIGAGTASALASGTTSDVRRWVIAGLVSDVLDVAAGLASARSTGARGLVSALVAAPNIGGDTEGWDRQTKLILESAGESAGR